MTWDRLMGGSYAVEITPLDYSNRSFGRRVANLRRSWVWLLRLHDRRRLRLSRAARRMEPGRLDTACHAKGHDHGQSRRSETRAQNTPILAHLGALIRDPLAGFAQFSDAQKTLAAAIGGGFVRLFSLFNIGGRFFWATLSDSIGRKTTYFGVVCYATAHTLADLKAVVVFAAAFFIIASMYGGGFATVPAYLADMFGTRFVGAIHGRLLTAWSTAGIMGPVIVNYLHDTRVAQGVPRDHVYDLILPASSSPDSFAMR